MSSPKSLERNLNKRQRSNDESNDRVDIQQKQIDVLKSKFSKQELNLTSSLK